MGHISMSSAARAQEEHRGRTAARAVQPPHPSQALVADMALARFNGRVQTPWELAEEADRQVALAEQQVLYPRQHPPSVCPTP